MGHGHDVQHLQWRHSMDLSTSINGVHEPFLVRYPRFPEMQILYISRNIITLKLLVKVIMYNIPAYAIRTKTTDFLSECYSNN